MALMNKTIVEEINPLSRKENNMIRSKDIIVDKCILGENEELRLTKVSPDYEYEGDKKTERLLGYKYECVSEEMGYEQLTVKIPGAQLIESPKSRKGFPVRFQDLELGISVTVSGRFANIRLNGTATGVKPAEKPSGTKLQMRQGASSTQ